MIKYSYDQNQANGARYGNQARKKRSAGGHGVAPQEDLRDVSFSLGAVSMCWPHFLNNLRYRLLQQIGMVHEAKC